jgi:hypothetical protein
MALERIGDPRSIPALIVALESHHGKDWAWNPASNAILNALEHFGTPEAKQAMRAYEEDVKHRLGSVSLLLENLEAERAYCLDHPDATDDLKAVTEWTCEGSRLLALPRPKRQSRPFANVWSRTGRTAVPTSRPNKLNCAAIRRLIRRVSGTSAQ